jgi:hypothetical protein
MVVRMTPLIQTVWRVPKSVMEAKQIDNENDNNLWMDAIKKEMEALKLALDAVAITSSQN